MNLREQIAKLLADIEALAKQENRTAEDSERGERMLKELEELEAKYNEQRALDAAAAKRAHFEEPATRSAAGIVPNGEAREERGNGQTEQRKGFDTRAFTELVDGYRKFGGKTEGFDITPVMEQRALVYTGAFPSNMTPPQILPGIQRNPEAIGTRAVRSVLLNGRTTSATIAYVQENVFTNAAATVAEAVSTVTGAKPESSLTFTQADAPVQVIAHWIPVSRQALDDVPMLQSYIEGRLLDGLVREENDQLLNGDGTAPNISGLLDQSGIQVLDQTYFTGAPVNTASGLGSAEMFNRILRAKTLVMTTGDSNATFIILNPTDYESLVTAADTTENYFGAGPFSNGGVPRIWGLDVVQTEAMTAGNYLVGDGTAAQVWDRWDARIYMADQHDDFFVRNLFVLLAEERLGLTVYRPSAFALVDVPA